MMEIYVKIYRCDRYNIVCPTVENRFATFRRGSGLPIGGAKGMASLLSGRYERNPCTAPFSKISRLGSAIARQR